jgi:hypothetical protein
VAPPPDPPPEPDPEPPSSAGTRTVRRTTSVRTSVGVVGVVEAAGAWLSPPAASAAAASPPSAASVAAVAMRVRSNLMAAASARTLQATAKPVKRVGKRTQSLGKAPS